MISDLFHAYIIAGHKEDARIYIDRFLKEHKVSKDTATITVSEHVVFTIEHVRELRVWQQLTPAGNDMHKIYVLYTSFLTREAENALLKTLEEPVPNTHIMIAIPKPETLLPTLLSRVQLLVPEATTRDGVRRMREFLSLSIAEQLESIKKISEKGDDEFASAEVREKAVAFFDDLEHYFASTISKENSESIQKIEAILKLKKYLFTPAVSVKNILETAVLAL